MTGDNVDGFGDSVANGDSNDGGGGDGGDVRDGGIDGHIGAVVVQYWE